MHDDCLDKNCLFSENLSILYLYYLSPYFEKPSDDNLNSDQEESTEESNPTKKKKGKPKADKQDPSNL